MLTWTDKPYETMWGHLRFLSYESNVRNLLCGGLLSRRTWCPQPYCVLQEKARQIAYSIVQAFEYYRAADAVTIDTSPLLYFYGMLSLAKALVVASEPGTLLDDMKYHGLKAHKTAESSELEEQGAMAKGGVFRRLTSVISGSEYPRNAVFSFKEVLSISPEISGMYERYFERPSRCLSLHMIRPLPQNPFSLELCIVAPSPAFVYERIPEITDDFELRTSGGEQGLYHWFKSKESLKHMPVTVREYRPATGGMYLVGPLPFTSDNSPMKRYIPPPLSDYIGMFILSDCVRYKQDLWRTVVQGKDTGILGLVDLYLEAAKRRFPNLILSFLFQENFAYDTRQLP